MLEHAWPAIVLGALFAAAEPPAPAPMPRYGQVETFQPGKRYNCVPTADHKGWNCREIGADGTPVPRPKTDEPATTPGKSAEPAPPPERTRPVPASAKPAEPASPPAKSAPATPPQSTPVSEPAAPAETEQSSSLPGYLTNMSARGLRRRPTSRPTATTPAQVATPPAPVGMPAETAPAAATSAASPAVETNPADETKESTRAASQQTKPNPPPAAVAQTTPTPASASTPPQPAQTAAPRTSTDATDLIRDGREFLDLPSAHFIVGMAHAATQTELPDASALPSLSHGRVYRLHLRQYGNDVWLLVWGDFADVESARAARSELVAQGFNPGWPRLIAPLQTEVRRVLRTTGP